MAYIWRWSTCAASVFMVFPCAAYVDSCLAIEECRLALEHKTDGLDQSQGLASRNGADSRESNTSCLSPCSGICDYAGILVDPSADRFQPTGRRPPRLQTVAHRLPMQSSI